MGFTITRTNKKPKEEDLWDAKRCIFGAYSAEQQAPDHSVGKTKNLKSAPDHICMLFLAGMCKKVSNPDHSFGVQSIRWDRPAPKLVSIANNTVLLLGFLN